jgi:hypothetical protein
MIGLLRIALLILGVLVVIFQLFHLEGDYRGMDSPIWGFALGIGLIVAPFTALKIFVMYILMVGIPLGLGFLGALFWVELFGKGGLAIIGFLAGGWVGFKFVISNLFDKLLNPFSALAKKDGE